MRDGVPKIEKVFIINCKPANKAVAPDRRSLADYQVFEFAKNLGI